MRIQVVMADTSLCKATLRHHTRGEAMTQFYKFDKNRRMHPELMLAEIILPQSTSRATYHFQYLQLQSLIIQIMGTGNLFRPLTAFELLITTGDRSKIYDMLLSLNVPEDKVKIQWERGFGNILSGLPMETVETIQPNLFYKCWHSGNLL